MGGWFNRRYTQDGQEVLYSKFRIEGRPTGAPVLKVYVLLFSSSRDDLMATSQWRSDDEGPMARAKSAEVLILKK